MVIINFTVNSINIWKQITNKLNKLCEIAHQTRDRDNKFSNFTPYIQTIRYNMNIQNNQSIIQSQNPYENKFTL